MIRSFIITLLFISAHQSVQSQSYTLADTLRGSITPQRAWWDLNYYHLDIEVDPSAKTIHGSNTIHYTPLKSEQELQIDLQEPLQIKSIAQNGNTLNYSKIGNAYFITLTEKQKVGHTYSLVVQYGGIPHEAIRAPWDGGITWSKDVNGNPFVASSCQGIGASIWWPCKDHMYDEVDSMKMTVTVPAGLMNIGNGRLVSNEKLPDGKNRTTWSVSNPINNYGVNINIGDYVHFGEEYNGENGPLDLDYYVLRQNLDKAKIQFAETTDMMDAFEHWFGPYPFYADGFKLVEAPYLGMEHQSSITYGNGYQNGYLGRDLSDSGWGLKFDFIIIHESGHEWFANNITYKDMADMWIHESFTAYSECLYVEHIWGKDAGAEYVIGTRLNISNDSPIQAPYGVNARGSGDMYYKGSNMLHTLRQVINDDILWRDILRGLNEEFYHQTVTGKQIRDYISKKSGKKLAAFFNQYLNETRIPILEYRIKDNILGYKWTNTVRGFDMPIKVWIDGTERTLRASNAWKSTTLTEKPSSVVVDKNYYVAAMNVTGQ